MMCPSVQGDLKAYLDGELPPLRRNAIRRHLSGCAACRKETQIMEVLHQELRDGEASDTALAPDLRDRILIRVADVTPLPAPRPPSRLLQYSFAASLIVNGLFLLMLNHADLYGTARTAAEQHRIKIQVYRPPVTHVRKSPPPPALKRPPPKPVLHVMKPPPLLPVSPPAPRGPAMGRTASHATPQAVDVGPVTQEPPVAAPQEPGTDIQPQAPLTTPAAPPSRVIERPASPVEAAPSPTPSPPPAPQIMAPKTALPDRDSPAVEGDWVDIILPTEIDGTTLNSTTVTPSWVVDAHGHVSDIRFPSTGNADVDDAIREAIRKNHFAPAVHNGQPVLGRMTHTFVITP